VKAVVHDTYGPPEVLRIADVERPMPTAGEVLVRVHATTVNRFPFERAAGIRAARSSSRFRTLDDCPRGRAR
jgi:hypothetical protein